MSSGGNRVLSRLRSRAGRQEGFTLVELLVVVLITGILAAIAIPTFLGQKDKANDASAKSLLTTGVTTMETYYTDSQTYVGADGAGKLSAIEPSISWVLSGTSADTSKNEVLVSGLSQSGFTLSTDISPTKSYTYTKSSSGISKTCTGCTGGTW
jgi:type IV pilus assembly protein PilA